MRNEPLTRTLEHLEALVAIPSVFTASDYVAITDYCEKILTGAGARCHRVESRRTGRAGLFASMGPGGPGGLMLSGHLDVVPVDGQAWTSDPFTLTRRDGRAYGRGTTDMKGFVACALALAERAAGRSLAAPLKFALSFDEEDGCLGIYEMMPSLAPTIAPPALCLVGEPTGMRLVTGHKGKVSYRLTCHGTAGHSARAPRHLNAMHLAADALALLRAEQDRLASQETRDPAFDVPYTTIHAGILRAGTALNIVPDRAELAFEIRHLATTDPDELRDRFQAQLASHLGRLSESFAPADATLEETNRYPGLDAAADSPMAALLTDFGAQFPAGKVDFGTEAGVFAAHGIPTYVCGPGSMEQGHKADEFIERSQLSLCDAMLDRALDWLATG